MRAAVAAQLEADIKTLFAAVRLPEPLGEASVYAMANGGKRARPLLAAAAFLTANSAKCGQACDEQALSMLRRASLAVELVHGYSLVHDDLPCMDDDELRRGKPTCHVVYGENVALLVGDVLQSLAFEVLTAKLPDFAPADEQVAARLMAVFAPRARRMVAGQMLDVMGEQRALSQDELQAIHSDKTGALIEAAVLMGGICAQLDDNELAQFAEYAKQLGLAFQVQDDVLDATGDTATLGKPAGSDDKLQKSTYVKLLGVQKAQQYADELYAKAMASVAAFQASKPSELSKTSDENLLNQLALWLKGRDK
ncbi:farnesyl-diphosphate synthase [Moraxella caviae]|nr:farnesyl-diphosphate synthase [Moraxella caviae]